MERYYQPEIECASREQILAWQNERLVKQVRHVWDSVPYYRKKMEEKGVTPDDVKSVDDLHKLPFLTKDDLREAYPYGLLARPLKDCVRIQSTSGTTGRRVVAFYTQHDIDLWEECCARAIVAAGGTNEDVCHVCYGYGLFTGGPGLNGGSHKVGCLTLPMSSGNTDRQLQFMVDLGSTILCCTPSYAAYLAESISERGLRDKIKLKAGIFGAEAWSEEMRRDIEQKLGIKAYDIYGLTEICGPGVSFECSRADRHAHQRGPLHRRDHRPGHRRGPPRGQQGRAGVHLHHQGGLPPAALPHPGHLRAHPEEVLLRPHPCEDEQAHGPQRRHAHHQGRQRLPLPDRDRAAEQGLPRQLPDHRGPGEQLRHPGGAGGDDAGDVLRHRGRIDRAGEGAWWTP